MWTLQPLAPGPGYPYHVGMWVLLISPDSLSSDPEAAHGTLVSLGCSVERVDLWGDFERFVGTQPPAVVLIEAGDEVDAARAAIARVGQLSSLRGAPVLVAVSVRALQRLSPNDPFDDIVLRPYVPAELYARIRRLEWRSSSFASEEVIKLGGLRLDLAGHEVEVDGRAVELTHQEFLLLKFLVQRRDRVHSRPSLLQQVWGQQYNLHSRTVDIHVRRLRAKLGAFSAHLETVRGAGYKLRTP